MLAAQAHFSSRRLDRIKSGEVEKHFEGKCLLRGETVLPKEAPLLVLMIDPSQAPSGAVGVPQEVEEHVEQLGHLSASMKAALFLGERNVKIYAFEYTKYCRTESV